MLPRSLSLALMFPLILLVNLSHAQETPASGEKAVPPAKNVALDKPITETETAAPQLDAPAPEAQSEPGTPEQPSAGTNPETTQNTQPEQSENTVSEAKTPTRYPNHAVSSYTPQNKTTEGDNKPAEQPEQPTNGKKTASPLRLLGAEVPPATSTRLAWSPSQHFEGVYSATSVLVVNGAEPGPTLCLTAAIHGDELNGIETVRRVMYNLNPKTLRGAVIGVPIVNLQGFHRSSRYLTDRRDLNRHFPGDAKGSSASRIAKSFFDEVVVHCNAIVDLHTGSFYRTNLPQLRGDLRDPKVVKMTKGFGSTVVLHSRGANGTLRRAAVNAGIPTVTLEAGAPMVLDETSVSHSVKGIRTLLNQLDMVSKFRLWGDPEPVYYNSIWQRATIGGIIFSQVELGESVREGDVLGTITNPITNVRKEIRSQYNGRILGMAMNQVVQPGFAAYHIGIQAPQELISPPEEVTAESDAPDPAQAPATGSEGEPSQNPTAQPGDSGAENKESDTAPENIAEKTEREPASEDSPATTLQEMEMPDTETDDE